MSITIDDIKIQIKIINSDSLYAQATVILLDKWIEHGWKILKSNKIHPDFQECLWIQAPSYKIGGDWKEIVFIDDKELFDQVKSKIYDCYRMAKIKSEEKEAIETTKTYENNAEEVNPEEIPF